jgi:hypothetical protein
MAYALQADLTAFFDINLTNIVILDVTNSVKLDIRSDWSDKHVDVFRAPTQ